MTHSRRTLAWAIAALLLLATLAAWSVAGMGQARQAAHRAGDDLVECQALAEAILSLRSKPALVATADLNADELGQRLQKASEFVGLAPQMLHGVAPGQPRRMGKSPYLQKPTTLTLRGMSLEQMAIFLFTLSNGTGLKVQQLRLLPTADATDGPLWDAQATVTYLVYAPSGRTPDDR